MMMMSYRQKSWKISELEQQQTTKQRAYWTFRPPTTAAEFPCLHFVCFFGALVLLISKQFGEFTWCWILNSNRGSKLCKCEIMNFKKGRSWLTAKSSTVEEKRQMLESWSITLASSALYYSRRRFNALETQKKQSFIVIQSFNLEVFVWDHVPRSVWHLFLQLVIIPQHYINIGGTNPGTSLIVHFIRSFFFYITPEGNFFSPLFC